MFNLKFLTFTFAFLLAQTVLANNDSNHHKQYFTFDTTGTGDQEVPPLDTDTRSFLELSIDSGLTMMEYSLYVYQGHQIDRAHLHCGVAGVSGGLILEFYNNPHGTNVNGLLAEGVKTTATLTANPGPGAAECGITNIASLFAAMRAGKVYLNVHSLPHPAGVNRGQILLFPQQY